ncbi:hypothetical protein M514_23121, partial [Trichuris suis]
RGPPGPTTSFFGAFISPTIPLRPKTYCAFRRGMFIPKFNRATSSNSATTDATAAKTRKHQDNISLFKKAQAIRTAGCRYEGRIMQIM